MAQRSEKPRPQPLPRFFRDALEFRTWLEKNHSTETELFVGYYKRHTDSFNYSWSETVDQALCYGWIDGVRRRIDDDRYMIRFTPRRHGSNWSQVNIKRMVELKKLGLVRPSGLKAFDARRDKQDARQADRPDNARLDVQYERMFQRNKKAWAFFESQSPSYRRLMIRWIMSAKKPDTRERRLRTLINHSKSGQRVASL